jgi:hypothetical protein
MLGVAQIEPSFAQKLIRPTALERSDRRWTNFDDPVNYRRMSVAVA